MADQRALDTACVHAAEHFRPPEIPANAARQQADGMALWPGRVSTSPRMRISWAAGPSARAIVLSRHLVYRLISR